ncbi:MAG: hypothetical protein AAFP19_04680 [Bacteroidota bacterium]
MNKKCNNSFQIGGGLPFFHSSSSPKRNRAAAFFWKKVNQFIARMNPKIGVLTMVDEKKRNEAKYMLCSALRILKVAKY